MTIKELTEELKKYPEEATVEAGSYKGERPFVVKELDPYMSKDDNIVRVVMLVGD